MNLILENDPTVLNEEVRELLSWNFKEDRHVWMDFASSFKLPELKEKSLEFLLNIPADTNIIAHTVFMNYNQLELMIYILYLLKCRKKPVNVYIGGCILSDDLNLYYKQQYSTFYPSNDRTKQFGDKLVFNKKLEDIVNFHNIIELQYAWYMETKWHKCQFKITFEDGKFASHSLTESQ